MTTAVVVDASVALKWVVTEPGSEQAGALLTAMAEGASTSAPETGHIRRSGRMTRPSTGRGLLVMSDVRARIEGIYDDVLLATPVKRSSTKPSVR